VSISRELARRQHEARDFLIIQDPFMPHLLDSALLFALLLFLATARFLAGVAERLTIPMA
jgi:hypothetical protein